MILLKISGATLVAYADPSIIGRCCDLLRSSNPSDGTILPELAKVRTLAFVMKMDYECLGLQGILQFQENGWEGLPLPPVLRGAEPTDTVLKSQDAVATQVATSLGPPEVGEQSQSPVLSPHSGGSLKREPGIFSSSISSH